MRRMAAAVLILAALNPNPANAAPSRCREYVNLGQQIGWPKKERENLWRIMERESGPGCNPAAINFEDPFGGSYGLLQINLSNLGWAKRQGFVQTANDLLHPATNLKVGLALYRLYGWRPWGTKSSVTNQQRKAPTWHSTSMTTNR